ncbi:MAG: 16S rRNA (cytosine(1402)-N(4))-methyltransferase RsmH [Candidatus Yanofskybacteria bacterium]|nr:16S rRNA (cytosine(1402)-N(4))-methyltransferase RsmH [Candidatus Yanofskybacteria bacterium]
MNIVHKPVLLKEVIEYLDPKPGDKIIDATLDGGGHSAAILEKVGPDGKVLGIEIDSELVSAAKLKIKNEKLKNLIVVNDSYTNIENIVREHNFRPNGILFDLGLSSWHYERSGRGFSFKRDEPLDMRYNPARPGNPKPEIRNPKQIPNLKSESSKQTLTAAEVVNTYSKEELEKIFREYGEEQFSKQIAENIISARRREPILTTSGLVEVIGESVPHWYKKKKIHFATKTFQALRIEVNSELENVEKGVSAAINVLEPACPEQGRRGGRLVVISFHGIEDKIVRELFKKKAKEGVVKWVIKGTIKPKWEEVKNNPRARSAKMKIVEKI